MRDCKFWRWPEFLHGNGHKFYDTEAAKELYGKQLVTLSEKLFLSAIAPFAGYFIDPIKFNIILTAISVIAITCVGLYFRHQGLRIIDELESGKIKIDPSSIS